ncbi:arylacetamide deacetylase-like 4 [Sceloporus undulatus]|uniref:arylacetamide deacetylase-like 4 n=1 Tax=Sceloporus undulatus TaxID=8520 RepID=UPI001C4C5052|nr:arylacetamide deacetylase-like 4 [Sceloporus undulatus]
MVIFLRPIAGALVTLVVYPVLFLISLGIQYARSVLPPGIDQPLKLRFYHATFISVFLWGSVLEKLRLYKFLNVLRLVTNGLPPFRDPSLLIQNEKFGDVAVKIYQPKKASTTKRKGLLYFHGGAGTYGSVDSYERILRYICKEADAVVVAVKYGLGPENPFPNQYVECEKAAIHFMKHAEDFNVDASRIAIAGDSCGANFVARICQLLVSRDDLPKVHAQVLIYPGLQGMDFYLPSYQQNSRVPIMWRETVIYFCCLYLNKTTSLINDVLESCHVPAAIRQKYRKWVHADLIPDKFKVRGYKPQDPALYKFKPEVYEEMKDILEETFSPLFASDDVVHKLPQTFLLTCEFDVLRDDGLLYKKRLEDNGVPVTWVHAENAIHGVAILFGYGIFSFPSAKRIVRETTRFIKNL